MTQVHLLAFEGPDAYSRASGIATRFASAGENALVIARDDPGDVFAQFDGLFARPDRVEAMHRAGLRTARKYTWRRVIDAHLLPRIAQLRNSRRGANARRFLTQDS